MNFETVKTNIEAWIEPLLNEKNLFLVDIRFPMGRQIEVFLDSDEGIHISQCAEVSRFLEKKLDESGLVPDNYILEVSSPGMSNPLKVPRQYKRRIGRVIEVLKTDGKTLEGTLIEADENKIKLREVEQPIKGKNKKNEKPMELKEFEIGFNDIKRATLQFKF